MSQSDKIQSLNSNHLTGVLIAKLMEHYSGIAEAGSLIVIRYFSGHFSMLLHELFNDPVNLVSFWYFKYTIF